MNKSLLLTVAMLFSGTALAATDHYIARDGNHVQHLKISTVGKDTNVTADVDFEPNVDEQGKHACASEITGEAKVISATELVLKKQIPGEARHCVVNIKLSNDGAKLQQSEDCSYFVTGICHFSTGDKELLKIK